MSGGLLRTGVSFLRGFFCVSLSCWCSSALSFWLSMSSFPSAQNLFLNESKTFHTYTYILCIYTQYKHRDWVANRALLTEMLVHGERVFGFVWEWPHTACGHAPHGLFTYQITARVQYTHTHTQTHDKDSVLFTGKHIYRPHYSRTLISENIKKKFFWENDLII